MWKKRPGIRWPGRTKWFELTPQECSQTADGRTACTHPAGDEFSMLLPHPWLVAREHLQAYMAASTLTWLVDNMTNCDDIFLNGAIIAATLLLPCVLLLRYD